MALKSSDVLTEEAVRQRVEAITQENLQFRAAFRDLDATGIDNDTFRIPRPKDNIGNPQAIPEGSEFPRDEEDYEKIDIVFEKYGFEVAITREAMQDSMLDIAADHVDRQARQMNEFLNDLAFQELDANLNSNSPAGGLGDTAKLEFEDVVNGKRELRAQNYSPDLLITNVQGEADLLTSNQFLRATDLGDDVVTEGVVGRVAGLDVVVSDAGHMASNDGEAYVVDTDFYGYEAVRENVMTNDYEAPERQAEMMQIWTRRGYKSIDPSAAIRVQS